MTDAEPDHRKVYARGYFDACRAHGISTEGGIVQQVKLDEKYKGLSGIAKKVFDATPISEPWDVSQIVGELKRQGVRGDVRTVAGCLGSLVASGVVVEPKSGHFVRVSVHKKVEHKPFKLVVPNRSEIMGEAKQQDEKPTVTDPIDRLTAISSRVNGAVAELVAIAKEMEAAALDLAESTEKTNADSVKLRQLQALLKGISQ